MATMAVVKESESTQVQTSIEAVHVSGASFKSK